MTERLIGYTTAAGQREEIERADGNEWEVVDWADELDPVVPQTAARSALRAATAKLVRREADGLVVRSLADLSDRPVHLGVLDWFLRLDARFVALRDRLDTREPEGCRRATEIVRRAGIAALGIPQAGFADRNVTVSEHIAPGSSVLDLGAGSAPLRELVASPRHVPADRTSWRVTRDGIRYLWWDPDVGVWPSFDERFDVVVLSGVAEYLADLDAVFTRLGPLADRLVFTYLAGRAGVISRASPEGRLTLDEIHALLDRHTESWSQVATWRAHRIFTAELPR